MEKRQLPRHTGREEKRLATSTGEISAPLLVAVSPSLLCFHRALFHTSVATRVSYIVLIVLSVHVLYFCQ